ncbi:mechanosensitive ion channel family protein [Synechococcus sp. NOUM97013]|uniref:mechanosensitive ion channel family protein n=1 Tax=Synechococcus sp. NOUM97013 TaxID=1442555 RepID=UPI001644B5D4|nr:mechanosensitive ion channel family protein [Synechococcus sp. NOUM97013]QNI74821.1 cyclic nucleotide-regulated small-conductance mechanosensitive ion channel [Synechococcus sp. NOUM97013]
MSLFWLVLLWLLTFVLGRVRQSRSFKYSRWIPGMLFFRVSLTAAILTRLLLLFEQQGEALIWLRLVESGALYVALVEVFLDVLWLVLARLGRRRVAPPRILKDLLLVAATMLIVAVQLQSQGLLTTLGSAAVLGGLAFVVGPGTASQISNISSALTFQVERQFSVGDWVEIDGCVGRVETVSWNSAYLYDNARDRMIILPNSVIDTGKVINFSRPTARRYQLDIVMGLPYEAPPGKIIAILSTVLDQHPGVVDANDAHILVEEFSDSSINYRLWFFIEDYMQRAVIKSSLFADAWYAVHRAGYSFPYPVEDVRTFADTERRDGELEQQLQDESFAVLRREPLLASLNDAQIRDIVVHDPVLSFGDDEAIVREGEEGGSMYVVLEGTCSVYVNAVMGSKDQIEVAELSQGDVFGEMAALTDEPRKASVLAKGHVMVQKISQRTINDQFLKNGDAMEAFAAFMAHREARRCEFTADQTETYELDLVERMRKTFARLFSSG